MARRKPRPLVVSPLCRRAEAIILVGGEAMLGHLERAGWLKRAAGRPGYVVFLRSDVNGCIARIASGELP